MNIHFKETSCASEYETKNNKKKMHFRRLNTVKTNIPRYRIFENI